MLIKTPADGTWRDAFETAASPSFPSLHLTLFSLCDRLTLFLFLSFALSLSSCLYIPLSHSRPLFYIFLTHAVFFCLSMTEEKRMLLQSPRSLSFISPHDGNIIEISLQEGCANTSTTPAHYRAVKRRLQPSLSVSHSFASSSAIPVRDLPTPHASTVEKHKLPNNTAPITEHSQAGPRGPLNSGHPSIRSC